MNALRHVRPGKEFVPKFPLFKRVNVNGKDRIPLYSWALEMCPSPHNILIKRSDLLYDPISAEDIRWNFEKILFTRKGKPFRRYSHKKHPFELKDDIEFLLSQ